RSMARELSQEAVLDFLWGAGGRAPNTALLRHFQRFLRDPALTEQQRRERREYFKSLVNSLATQLPTRPSPSPSRGSRVLNPNGPTQPQAPLLHLYKTLPLPSSSGLLAPTRLPPSQSPPQSPTEAPPSWSLQPPPARLLPSQSPTKAPLSWPLQLPRARPPVAQSPPQSPTEAPPSWSLQPPSARSLPSQSPPQSLTQGPPARSLQPPPARPLPSQFLLPAQGPVGPHASESSPPAPLPVFRSIRCQLALLEVQGIPPSLPDDCGRQPRIMLSKSCPRNVPSRGLSVPLGQREHAWLVAVSAGRWAQVRGLFLEEPELALQRDFMSGFTVLHWLAKHGDGPGLQELAAAAQQAGLALDVDARSGCGYTPLHLAAIHGHQLVIKVLVLQLGCQVQVRDSNGRRPWEYLGSSTSGEIWQLLEAP
ncbi:SWAHB protein, partial [Rhinoptilus africanus]|nr:SWAHB protein [Rhinoptilus africanus]